MSRWGSNATWQAAGTRFSCRKGAKRSSHVAMEDGDVVLGFQRDVAEAESLFFERKRGQKWAPRRIGGERCRVGAPTRHGCSPPPHLPRKKIGRLSKLVL